MNEAIKYVFFTLSLLVGIICSVLAFVHLFIAGSSQSIPVSTNDLLYIHSTSILSLLFIIIAVKGFKIKIVNIIISILYLLPVIFYIGVYVNIINNSYSDEYSWNITILMMVIYNIFITVFSFLLILNKKN
ncbi:hypothetical protein MUN88_20345 [Gracilibacillus caseinilyticus]|uniref:Uncharacterized protein n=1 Tax=Gracilibacillus caseinilyticus TaxID=2932256 RepID=A0ABY4EWZ4_9BACI|nr:hypothetical protein [Gracilibacillus caseinilyticus]UOQ48357.1 hypothetical protein MUN88_20345 [Gracilibacillus caseinilyticus]